MASAGSACVHDLRKTFSNWCEGAGIPRTRRRLYLGHGRRDVTDLYEEHDVSSFLENDAKALRRFVGADMLNGSAGHPESREKSREGGGLMTQHHDLDRDGGGSLRIKSP